MSVTALFFSLAIASISPAPAQEPDEPRRSRRFFGEYIQLDPILVPFQGARGIQFDAITVRLVIGRNATANVACWSAPFVHQEILFSLYESGLTRSEVSDENMPKLAERLMQIATDITDEGVYERIDVVLGGDPAEEDSRQVTNLCK